MLKQKLLYVYLMLENKIDECVFISEE